MSVFSESWSPATASAWAVSAFQAAQLGTRVLRARMNPAAHKPAERTASPGCDDEHIRVRRVAPPETVMTRIRAEVVPGAADAVPGEADAVPGEADAVPGEADGPVAVLPGSAPATSISIWYP